MIKQPNIVLHRVRRGEQGAGPLSPSEVHLGERKSRLLGSRKFMLSFLAASTRSHMGPARHALSQMVVAGLMHPSPPVRILVEKS